MKVLGSRKADLELYDEKPELKQSPKAHFFERDL
jgi:hypothetical protein